MSNALYESLPPGDFTRLTSTPQVWRRQDALVQRRDRQGPQRVSDLPLKLTDRINEPGGIGARRGELRRTVSRNVLAATESERVHVGASDHMARNGVRTVCGS